MSKESDKKTTGILRGKRSCFAQDEVKGAVDSLYQMLNDCGLAMKDLVDEFNKKTIEVKLPRVKGTVFLKLNHFVSKEDAKVKCPSQITWRKVTFNVTKSSGNIFRSVDLPGRLQTKNMYSTHSIANKEMLKDFDARAEKLNLVMKKITEALASVRLGLSYFERNNVWEYPSLFDHVKDPPLMVRKRRTKQQLEMARVEQEEEDYGHNLQQMDLEKRQSVKAEENEAEDYIEELLDQHEKSSR